MKHSSIENLLEEDHASVSELIAQLCVFLDERDMKRAYPQLDLVWARLAVHIRAEHLCLFPAILDAARQISIGEGSAPQLDEAQSALKQLRHDHDFFMVELARAVNLMRKLRASPASETLEKRLPELKQTINAVKTRLENHNRLEEEQVYRWPAALLNTEQQVEMVKGAQRELENMPQRFARSSQVNAMASLNSGE